LLVVETVIAVDQPADALTALRNRLDSYDVWRLTGAQSACAAAGSLVLALAMAEGRIDGDECFELSALDETYQINQWGEDYEAADRRANLRADMVAAHRFLSLL
jgi:chaperone required for assembly of F1-ATPase